MKNKIQIDRELFLSKLNKAIKFVSTKSIIPAFENFLLIVTGSNMDIIATDGNIQVKLNCAVRSSGDFSVCINAKWLIGNVALYRENEVVITQKDEKKIEMKCGKSKGNLTVDCLPNNFSVMTMNETDSEMIVHQSLLKTGLKSAEKFVDDESQNANMTAINISEVNAKMIFTGLTQRHMCRAAITPIAISKWASINIHTETANKASILLEDKGEVVVVHDKEKICFFTSKEDNGEMFEVMSVTAHVKFPGTEKLFSNKPEKTVVINTLEFRDAVKRLKMYTEAGMSPKFVMQLENDELILTAQDTLTGRNGEERISLTEPSKNIIHKGYSNDDFLQILSLVESNDFIFHFESTNATRGNPSFVIPKVNTKEEDIFSFLIANQSVS